MARKKKNPDPVVMVRRSYRLPEKALKTADLVAEKLNLEDVHGIQTVMIRRAVLHGLRAFIKNPELAKRAASIKL